MLPFLQTVYFGHLFHELTHKIDLFLCLHGFKRLKLQFCEANVGFDVNISARVPSLVVQPPGRLDEVVGVEDGELLPGPDLPEREVEELVPLVVSHQVLGVLARRRLHEPHPVCRLGVHSPVILRVVRAEPSEINEYYQPDPCTKYQ